MRAFYTSPLGSMKISKKLVYNKVIRRNVRGRYAANASRVTPSRHEIVLP